MTCLTIVLVLGRFTNAESLELILAPILRSVSNRTTHFCVLIQADTSVGRADGINIVVMISSVAYLLELIVRTFLLRAMGSNRVIVTLEQHVDVLDELVRDNRVEVKFTLATNGMELQMIVIQTLQSTRSFTDSDTARSRLPVRTPCIMLNFFELQLNAD